jgi:hypothetical protein
MRRTIADGPQTIAKKEREKMFTVSAPCTLGRVWSGRRVGLLSLNLTAAPVSSQMYLFEVKDENNKTWNVERRFSQIKAFKKELVSSGAEIVKGWELPSTIAFKKNHRKLAPETVEKRKAMLETFLSLAVSFFGKHPLVKRFLASEDDQRMLMEHGYGPASPDMTDMTFQNTPDGREAEYEATNFTGTPQELMYDTTTPQQAQPSLTPAPAPSSPSGSASVAGQKAVITAAVVPSSPAELPLQEGQEVTVLDTNSANWWRVRCGEQEGFVSPKNIRVLEVSQPTSALPPSSSEVREQIAAIYSRCGVDLDVDKVLHEYTSYYGQGTEPELLAKVQEKYGGAPAHAPVANPPAPASDPVPGASAGAPVRELMLMVVANELVPMARKMRVQVFDVASLTQQIATELELSPTIQVAPAVEPGAARAATYTSLDQLGDKVKVQVWLSQSMAPAPVAPVQAPAPAPQAAAAAAVAPAPSAAARDFLLMVVANPVVTPGRKLVVQGCADLAQLLAQISTQLQIPPQIMISAPVPEGYTPSPFTHLDQLPPKAKIQVWPASNAGAAAVPEGVPPHSGGEVDAAAMVAAADDSVMAAMIAEEEAERRRAEQQAAAQQAAAQQQAAAAQQQLEARRRADALAAQEAARQQEAAARQAQAVRSCMRPWHVAPEPVRAGGPVIGGSGTRSSST